jgi:hypothetical protein
VSDIQKESQAVLDSTKENDFHGAFETWKNQWNLCIRSQGDYFEGDGGQNCKLSQHLLFYLVRELFDTPRIIQIIVNGVKFVIPDGVARQ